MTNKEIKDKIENDFGWLTPDEKQKLNSLLISVWNDAVVASARLVEPEISEDKPNTHEQKGNFVTMYRLIPTNIKASINALKLKL